jgi:hypothetical protein
MTRNAATTASSHCPLCQASLHKRSWYHAIIKNCWKYKTSYYGVFLLPFLMYAFLKNKTPAFTGADVSHRSWDTILIMFKFHFIWIIEIG